MKRRSFSCGFVCALVLAGCTPSKPSSVTVIDQSSSNAQLISVQGSQSSGASSELLAENVALVGPDGQRLALTVEVADEPAEQEQGLMGRTEIAENHGMLFVFPKQKVLTFWMKNTLIPLDIAFFALDGTFVSSATMIPCAGDPCPTHSSADLANTALELPAGFLEQNGVGEEWALER